MIGSWVFLRAELRRRWRAWLSVALLAAAFAGVVTAAAAGARRTDSAYPRLLAWSKAPDMLILSIPSVFPPLPRAALAKMPQVTSVGYVRQIALAAHTDLTLLAPEDNRIPGSFWKRKIVAGRLANPGSPDEINVSFMLAETRHLRPGDTLRVLLAIRHGKTELFVFRVAGIEAAASEFPPQLDTGPPDVWATLAFWRTHRAVLQAFPEAAVRLRHGTADVVAVQRLLGRLAHGKNPGGDPLAATSASTEHSIHLQAVALWLLAGILGVIGVLILGQVLIRLTFVESTGYTTLRALGMSRGQLLAIGVGRAAAIGTTAACVTVALAFGLSPLLPVGLAGVAEPHPGLDADGLVLVSGGLATVVVTMACAVPAAWRAATSNAAPAAPAVPAVQGHWRPVISMAGGTRSAARMMGVRLALQPGAGRTALPVRGTIAGATIGVAALSAAMVFAASLGQLLSTPRLYGVTWDAIVGSTSGANLTPVARIAAHDRDVAAWSVGNPDGTLQVNGISVGAIAMSSGRGPSLMAAPVQGRLPQGQGEITLGARTLALTHAHVGATALVSFPGQRPVRFKIVGTAIFPALSDGLGLGQGAALTLSGARHLPGVPAVPLNTLLVRFRPDADPSTVLGTLTSRVTRAGPFFVHGPSTPMDLVNFGRVQSLPMLLGIALSGLTLASIAHLLITSVRRRRRDFAILHALGFTHSQVRRTAAWQAGTLTSAGLAIGIPAGIVCGRAAWLVFAHHLGIRPAPDIPLSQFAVVIAIALGLAVAIAALPGEAAARVKPAHLLSSE